MGYTNKTAKIVKREGSSKPSAFERVFFFPNILYKKVKRKMFTMERTTLKAIAHQKFATLNPGTKKAVNSMKNALMTKVNKPSVSMFIGSVRIRIKGFTKTFRIPITTATTTATQKLGIVMPAESRYPVTKTASDLIKR